MPEYIRYLLRLLLWVVALMTGVLSIMRELLGIYRPNEFQTRSLFWNCVIIAFIISAAILWFIEHQKAAYLEKQLEREKSNKEPKLNTVFDVFATAPAGEQNEDSIVIITATITNTGAPSIVSDIEISIRTEEKEVKGEPIVLAPGPMFLEGENHKLFFKEEDYLPKKGMSQPIPTGGGIHGFNVVLVRNIRNEKIFRIGTVAILNYKDVSGKLYEIQKPMSKALSKIIEATKLQKGPEGQGQGRS